MLRSETVRGREFFTCVDSQVVQCFFDDGYHDTHVYLLESLGAGNSVPGPAILIETNRYQSLVVCANEGTTSRCV